MIWIYVASAIFGLAFLVPMVLGGVLGDFGGDGGLDLDTDLDADLDVDVDVDADVGVDADLDADGAATDYGSAIDAGALDAVLAALVSFRTIVFFSAFFGTAGLVFGAFGYGTLVTAVTAGLIGAIAAVINSTLFGLLKNSQSTSQITDQTLEGRRASVVLPMDDEHRGRIKIDLSGQPQFVVAKPIDAATRFEVGTPVVVVRMENGTALVSSLRELEGPAELEEP